MALSYVGSFDGVNHCECLHHLVTLFLFPVFANQVYSVRTVFLRMSRYQQVILVAIG